MNSLYFAFGSCMHQQDLARTVQAETVGPARLAGYRLAFTKYGMSRQGGVADLVEAREDYTEGMVFRVPDFAALDAREGAPVMYVRVPVQVKLTETGEILEVHTYMIREKEDEEIKPSDYYAGLITEGAGQLSEEYQAKLRRVLAVPRKSGGGS